MKEITFDGPFSDSKVIFKAFGDHVNITLSGCLGATLSKVDETILLIWLLQRRNRKNLEDGGKRFNPCASNCQFCSGESCVLCPDPNTTGVQCNHDFIDRHGWKFTNS